MKTQELYVDGASSSNGLTVNSYSTSSLQWENSFSTSGNVSFESEHFPIFDVNKKMATILGLKQRSAHGTVWDEIVMPNQSVKVGISTSHVMSISANKYKFWTETAATNNIASSQVVNTSFGSKSVLNPLGGTISNQHSCPCCKAGNVFSGFHSLLVHNHLPTCTNLTLSKQEPCVSSHQEKQMSLENKSRDKLLTVDTSPWLGTYDQYSASKSIGIRKLEMGTFGRPDAHPVSDFGSSQQLSKMSSCAVHQLEPKIPNSTDIICEGLEDNTNSNVQTPRGNAIGVQNMAKMSDVKKKGPCLFEMVSLPSKSVSTNQGGVWTCDQRSVSQLLGSHMEVPKEADVLSSDRNVAFRSPPGLSSHVALQVREQSTSLKDAHQDSITPLSARANMVSTSETMRYNRGRALLSIDNGHCQSSEEPASTGKFGLDQGERWLNRLHCGNPGNLLSRSKRFKNRNSPLNENMLRSSSKSHDSGSRMNEDMLPSSSKSRGSDSRKSAPMVMINYNQDEHQQLSKKQKTGTPHPSHVPTKSFQNWIRRWCHNRSPQAPPNEEEKVGHFPSIAAMAMMGKAISKQRPCQYRRRGPSIVWSTEF